MRGTMEKFVHPSRLVKKRANDSGGECSNYAVGLAEKYNAKHRVNSPCVACPAPSEDVPCPAGECRDAMPGCKIVLDKKGVNTAYDNYIMDGGKTGCAGTSQLGLMLNQPETERVLAAPRSTGVNEENWTSPSQKLVGEANPKFLIPPVVVAPSQDIEFWKTNNLVVRSGINEESTFDDFSSGYLVRPLPIPLPPDNGMIAAQSYQLPNTEPCESDPKPIHQPKKGYEYEVVVKTETPRPADDGNGEQNGADDKNDNVVEGFEVPTISRNPSSVVPTLGGDPSGRFIQTPATCTINPRSVDIDPQDPAEKAIAQSKCGSYNEVDLRSNEPCLSNTFAAQGGGDIVPACMYTPGSRNPQPGSYLADLFAANQFASENQSLIGRTKARILPCTTCDKLVDDKCMIINNGYHVDNLKVGLPTNFAASEGGKSPATAQLNSDTFTQTIVPGVYSNSQIIEPINSMIGISLTSQIPPTTLSEQDGDLLYQLHDPNLYKPPPPEEPDQSPNATTVTDPRYYGYGASNRAYHEPMTGQTRFYYEDVNTIRMPNYIARSKIDTNPWADKYEPCPEGSALGNPNTRNIRKLANNAFRDATIEHRTSMMQSLMRKRNAELYQMRMMPKSLGGSFGALGGSSSVNTVPVAT